MTTLTGHAGPATQGRPAGEGNDHPQALALPMPNVDAPAGQTPESTNMTTQPRGASSVRVQNTATANTGTEPTVVSPLPSDSLNGHARSDAQTKAAVEGIPSATPATLDSTTKSQPPGLADQNGSAEHGQRRPDTQSGNAVLADPTLALLADVLDDLERTRIANENRLRQLTRTETDADGEDRGFGLPLEHPDVARLAGVVDGIAALEHQATLNLARVMRTHPLGPWVKAQLGVGEKQAARLLAALGDPYWNTLHDRPRTVSELWAYCGLHVIRTDHRSIATHVPAVGAEQNGDPGHGTRDIQGTSAGVAARRRKGEKANWSSNAKMRAWNIAGSMLKAGNRDVYDKRKTATEGRTHAVACIRCGPSGKPAQPGSPWSDAHRHADALRIVSKALLRDLWIAARNIHLGHTCVEDQTSSAEVEQP